MPENIALQSVITIPYPKPSSLKENIVAMFEKPGFAPGGTNGRGGMRFSKKESESAKAHKIPINAIFFVKIELFFILLYSVCYLLNVVLFAFYGNYNFCRQTGSSVAAVSYTHLT